jgi:class 3 adenylate cyclase
MSLTDDLKASVGQIISEQWQTRRGYKVPEPTDLRLGNDGTQLDAAVLYADIADSTVLVDNYSPAFAAEVYKSYLLCAARIIRQDGGEITAYDGDRVMGVFIHDKKENAAIRAAMRINWAVLNIINPALQRYGANAYQMKHVVGIDTSPLFAARIGPRNYNDIVWVGRAANYAAKLAALNDAGYPIFITGSVYDNLDNAGRFGGNPLQHMWEERAWTTMNNMRIFRSNWWCVLE